MLTSNFSRSNFSRSSLKKRIMSRQYVLDKTGMWTSTLCAIHCIVVPIIVSMSAFSSWAFLHDERIENAVLILSAIIAVTSLVPSFIKHHRRLLPILILLMGFSLIGLSRLVTEVHESIFASSGAALVAVSHFLNYRYCKKSHVV
jgi:hypothetical protein